MSASTSRFHPAASERTSNHGNFEAVKSFLASAREDDIVVVFMAGHGLLDSKLDYYFASYDIDFAQPEVKGIAYGAHRVINERDQIPQESAFYGYLPLTANLIKVR
jgi:hypothetical protein